MGGLTLPQLLRAEDALKSAGGVVKDKCVVSFHARRAGADGDV